MTCAEALRTQALLDGELEGAEAAAAERHMQTCSVCGAARADQAALSLALRSHAVRYPAPSDLAARVSARLDAASMGEERRQVGGRFWMGAATGAALTGMAAALAFLAVLPPSATDLASAVTQAHTNALLMGREIAVVSTDHHTVKPWFAGRIGLSPPVTDFASQGFRLTGGRLDRVAGRPAAVVVYGHGRHEIDLFVWADQGAALPASSLRHGYRTNFWKRGDLDFAAVSDVQAEELDHFSALVRAAPE